MGVNILIALGIIKFINPGRRNGIGRVEHAEVERRILHRNGLIHVLPCDGQFLIAFDPGVRSQIADEISGKTIVAPRIHGTNGEAVPMGEHKMAVLPGA